MSRIARTIGAENRIGSSRGELIRSRLRKLAVLSAVEDPARGLAELP